MELISGLLLWLADPIRLWKLGWLGWHTPSNPASNLLWPYTGVWLLRTSKSRPVQAFLNNPNIDHLFLSFSLLLSVEVWDVSMHFLLSYLQFQRKHREGVNVTSILDAFLCVFASVSNVPAVCAFYVIFLFLVCSKWASKDPVKCSRLLYCVVFNIKTCGIKARTLWTAFNPSISTNHTALPK